MFICHASRDKKQYVDSLVKEIDKLGIRHFYDTYCINWGDNWKKVITENIKKTRFALVIISNNSIGREWTEKELHLFLELQEKYKEKIILPLIYNVSPKKVIQTYPELQEIQYINTKENDQKDIVIKFAGILIERLKNNSES